MSYVPNPLATFFFKQDESGWSESYYAVDVPGLKTLLERASLLAGDRWNLCGYGVSLTHIRVSYDGIYRDSKVVPKPDLTSAYKPPGNAQVEYNATVPFRCVRLLCDGDAPGLYHKTIFLHGLPQNIMVGDPGPVPTANWNQLFGFYVNRLTGGGQNPIWGFKVRNRDAAPTVRLAITGFAFDPVKTVVTCPGHTFSEGDLIRISLVELDQELVINGLYYVKLPIDPGVSFTIDYGTLKDPKVKKKGYVLPQGSLVKPFTKVQLNGISTHKVGRPYRAPKGRRKRAKAV